MIALNIKRRAESHIIRSLLSQQPTLTLSTDGRKGVDEDPVPYVPSEGSASDVDPQDVLRARIDPYKGQFTDFLRNVSIYEEQTKDVEMPYFMEQGRLRGHATHEGTDKYYRRAMNEETFTDTLEVSHEHFKTPFNSDLKLTSIGIGSYVGDPDDQTDFYLYDAIK